MLACLLKLACLLVKYVIEKVIKCLLLLRSTLRIVISLCKSTRNCNFISVLAYSRQIILGSCLSAAYLKHLKLLALLVNICAWSIP
jgi:hypothetical protein